MKSILIGDSRTGPRFDLFDPDGIPEAELELYVAQSLIRIYPRYHCVVFTGTFSLDGRRYRPDLALIARDWSDWFVIEVELLSHSLHHHVLPQVRAFQYGEPNTDCLVCLVGSGVMNHAQAETFLRFVPRNVAVIANKSSREWETAVAAVGAQLLTVSVFSGPDGSRAIQVDGTLFSSEANLGFGRFKATDRAVLFSSAIAVPDGEVQIQDLNGVPTTWFVVRSEGGAWVVKKVGVPDIPDGSYVQLVRRHDGGLALKAPTSQSQSRQS